MPTGVGITPKFLHFFLTHQSLFTCLTLLNSSQFFLTFINKKTFFNLFSSQPILKILLISFLLLSLFFTSSSRKSSLLFLPLLCHYFLYDSSFCQLLTTVLLDPSHVFSGFFQLASSRLDIFPHAFVVVSTFILGRKFRAAAYCFFAQVLPQKLSKGNPTYFLSILFDMNLRIGNYVVDASMVVISIISYRTDISRALNQSTRSTFRSMRGTTCLVDFDCAL